MNELDSKAELETKEVEVEVVESNLNSFDLSRISKESVLMSQVVDWIEAPEEMVVQKFSNSCSRVELGVFLYTKFQSVLEQAETHYHTINPENQPFKHKYLAWELLREFTRDPMIDLRIHTK